MDGKDVATLCASCNQLYSLSLTSSQSLSTAQMRSVFPLRAAEFEKEAKGVWTDWLKFKQRMAKVSVESYGRLAE